MHSLEPIFAENGQLAKHISAYRPRPLQLDMANAINESFRKEAHLAVEAGTGTGKTFAYLVPALLAQHRAIISTGTKFLQEQIFFKDLPLIQKALDEHSFSVMLKGRNNYLCTYRLHRAMAQARLPSRTEVRQLNTISEWALHTKEGDIAEVSNVPENAPVWYRATSTTDNCLGGECPDLKKCFVYAQREKAQQADILVVNHHLYFADLALRQKGIQELLPDFPLAIFDEAHQLAQVASQHFTTHVSSRAMERLLNDMADELLTDAPEQLGELKKLTEQLNEELDSFFAPLQDHSDALDSLSDESQQQLQAVVTQFDDMKQWAQHLGNRSQGLDTCIQRFEQMQADIKNICYNNTQALSWYRIQNRQLYLNLTPVDLSEELDDSIRQSHLSCVFTSATLTVDGSFDYFKTQLGLDDIACQQWESPYDYRKQSILYAPSELPDPRASDYPERLLEQTIPVIKAAGGKTFFLFTSHAMLQNIASQLPQHIDFPILVQGEMPKRDLVEKFRLLGNAVLLGTASFWEGVDIRGPELSLVIIDRLPFSSPSDPVLKANINHLKREGKDPFRQLQLPEAVISLKQGAGRLIRDYTDHGVLMICDPRIYRSNYGKIFVASLPPMSKTQDIRRVKYFFETIQNAVSEEPCIS